MEKIVKRVLVGLRQRDIDNLHFVSKHTGLDRQPAFRRALEALVEAIKTHHRSIGK